MATADRCAAAAPHRKKKHVAFGKNAAVKQPSVPSFPFKSRRFIPAVKKPVAVPTSRAR